MVHIGPPFAGVGGNGNGSGGGGYNPPPNGIPAEDLNAAIRSSLGRADTALQAIADGTVTGAKLADGTVGLVDLVQTVKDSLLRADTAMQTIPAGAVATGQLAADVQAALALAGTALQAIGDGTVTKTQLATAVQTSLGKADTALQSIPSITSAMITDGTITGSDLATSIVASLAKADTALQAVPALTGTNITDGTIALIDLSSTVQASLTKADNAKTKDATRAGVFPFEYPASTIGVAASAPYTVRQLFQIPLPVIRWRLGVANYNAFTAAFIASGALTGFAAAVGDPVYGADGEWTGAMTAAGTAIQTAVAIPAGARYFTAWQAGTVGGLNVGGKPKVLSYSFIAPANGQVAFGNAGNWQASNAGLSTQAAATGFARAENASPLELFIEYEFADDNAPVLFAVTSSLGNGGNNNQTPNLGPVGSFAQQWAQKHKGVAASIAISGTSAFHFATGNTRWDRFNGLNTALDVDEVFYFQPISSDILSGADGSASVIAACKTNYLNMIARGKALFPNARHTVSNLSARQEFTGDGTVVGTFEYARLQCNEWLARLPGGVDACVDVDSLLSDSANPARLRAVMSADGTHGKPRYHQAVASVVPLVRG